MTDHLVASEADLAALYGSAAATSLIKELDHISDDYRAFIDAAPFVVIATAGPGGLDCSPRGDPAGFVRVLDRHTVAVPDRRGNNRIDSLRNLVADPRIGLLFLIPGIGETLRLNGRAVISTAPDLCASFAIDGKAPKTVLRVTAERVYFQCSKALVRSRLWDPSAQIARAALPSTGTILANISATVDAAAYDAAYPERLTQTIY